MPDDDNPAKLGATQAAPPPKRDGKQGGQKRGGPDEIAVQGEWPDDFKQLWRRVQQLRDAELFDRLPSVDEAPGRRREVLAVWLAQQLGYSRLFRRSSSLRREPLWDLVAARGYARLSEHTEKAVAMMGRSTRRARSFLHPWSALATLAIWRHSDDDQLVREAADRLAKRPLPGQPDWLYEVVGAFIDDDSARRPTAGRSLAQLVELVLDNSFWEIGAQLAALRLVHRWGRWYHGGAESNLIYACDVAAREYPHEAKWWLDALARATMGGRLSHSWLEEPLRAAVRLSIDDPKRERRLRRYLEGRPFDAGYGRLEQLYATQLEMLREGGAQAARRRLLRQVETTVDRHPVRALRLLELMVIHEYGPRVGARFYRLRKALDELAARGDPRLCGWMAGLYVHTATLQPHAAKLVREVGQRVDWEANPVAGRDDYETYLVISDYDRAFDELTCKFDGVTLEHADKYAAARIKFFVQKRVNPGRIHRLVQSLFRPVEWLGSGLTEVGVVSDAIERGMERFERNLRSRDHREEVVERFRQAGAPVEQFGDIESLPVHRVDAVVDRLCNRRMLVGAAAGGISGGLAPFSWGILSLGDIPVMLSLTADVCSRFCWYYGFDPRDYPDLPFEVLAVGLGGARPEAIEPMLVRQSLHSHVVRKSIVVGALAHGGVAHLTGKGLSRLIQRRVEKSAVRRASEFARRAVTRNFRRRTPARRGPKGMPLVGAAVGAALNTMLLYDICEAAKAVLTDRFLERKYPEWVRHIERIESSTDTERRQ